MVLIDTDDLKQAYVDAWDKLPADAKKYIREVYTVNPDKFIEDCIEPPCHLWTPSQFNGYATAGSISTDLLMIKYNTDVTSMINKVITYLQREIEPSDVFGSDPLGVRLTESQRSAGKPMYENFNDYLMFSACVHGFHINPPDVDMESDHIFTEFGINTMKGYIDALADGIITGLPIGDNIGPNGLVNILKEGVLPYNEIDDKGKIPRIWHPKENIYSQAPPAYDPDSVSCQDILFMYTLSRNHMFSCENDMGEIWRPKFFGYDTQESYYNAGFIVDRRTPDLHSTFNGYTVPKLEAKDIIALVIFQPIFKADRPNSHIHFEGTFDGKQVFEQVAEQIHSQAGINLPIFYHSNTVSGIDHRPSKHIQLPLFPEYSS